MNPLLSRRELLAGAASVAFAKTPARVIDTHTHFYDPSRPEGVPWPAKNNTLLYRQVLPKQYKEVIKGLGVTQTIVVEASPLLEDNQWILDLAKDEPIIGGFVGHLEPGKEEFRSHLARFSKNSLFRGIRIGDRVLAEGLRQQGFVDDMKRLSDAGLQVDLLGGAPMLANVAVLSDRVPELRIVIDHLPFDNAPQQLLGEVAKRPKVFIKVSNVLRQNGSPAAYRDSLENLWTVFGPDRLIYGSNWPVSDRMGTYAEVFKVVAEFFTAKGESASEKYFFKNALIAYGIR